MVPIVWSWEVHKVQKLHCQESPILWTCPGFAGPHSYWRYENCCHCTWEISSRTSSVEGLFAIQLNQYQADKVLIWDQRLSTPQMDWNTTENLRIQDFLTDTQQSEAQHRSKVQEMLEHIHKEGGMQEWDKHQCWWFLGFV